MKGSKSVDEYILEHAERKEALEMFRKMCLRAGLDETMKWGVPVYTLEGKNIAGIACFKSYTGIWFYQGAYLRDEANKLVNAQEGVTKALRQWRFSSTEEIIRETSLMSEYLMESVHNQKNGIGHKPGKNAPPNLPAELQNALKSVPGLRDAFHALTPSKQRDYIDYISSAKRSETKSDRISKIIPMVMGGKGLHDKYLKSK